MVNFALKIMKSLNLHMLAAFTEVSETTCARLNLLFLSFVM